MHDTKGHQLEALISALDDHRALLTGHGLAHSALFLAAAKLDLQMQLYGISDEELWALCEALDRRPAPASGAAEAGAQAGLRGENGNVVSISGRRHQRHAADRGLRAPPEARSKPPERPARTGGDDPRRLTTGARGDRLVDQRAAAALRAREPRGRANRARND